MKWSSPPSTRSSPPSSDRRKATTSFICSCRSECRDWHVRHLWLNDFRSYGVADVELAAGLTVILGANGEGKTNLLEGLGYLATLASFRGAPLEAMIRDGAERAIVRAEGVREGRELLIEAELVSGGRSRVQVNRQRLQRSRDLL